MLDIDDLIQIHPGQSFITTDDHTIACCSNFPLIAQIACDDPADPKRMIVNYSEIKTILPDPRNIKWAGF